MKRPSGVSAGLVVIVLGAGSAALAQPATARHQVPSIVAVHPSRSPTADDGLFGVVAMASDDVWVVGYHKAPGAYWQPVMRRYDGESFTRMGSLRGRSGRLCAPSSVDATSDEDVWLSCRNEGWGPGAYLEHWDGSRWRRQLVPGEWPPDSLSTVWADAPDDVWAGGAYRIPGGAGPGLLAHYDGSDWQIVTQSGIGTAQVTGISGTSTNDVWVVGSYFGRSQKILHYDGRHWRVVENPASDYDVSFEDVVAVAADDVWVVGYSSDFDAPFSGTVILHWDGISWAYLDPGDSAGMRVKGVSASSTDDVWMVGYSVQSGEARRAAAIRWDGSTLTASFPTSPPGTMAELYDVSANRPDDVWAVGRRFGPHEWQRMIQHWNGHRWSRRVGR